MKNRYGDEFQFRRVDDNTYEIVGDLKYWRYGGQEGADTIDDDNLGFVDPSGGPFIAPGYQIEGRVVTRIRARDQRILFEVKPTTV